MDQAPQRVLFTLECWRRPGESVWRWFARRSVAPASMKGSRRREAVRSAVVAALLGGLALIVAPTFFENLSYDFLFALKPSKVPQEVVIAYMDEPSHRSLQQPWNQAWDRSLHARFVDRVRSFGAKAVVFDVLFDIANTNHPSADERLVQAVRRFTNVIVAGTLDPILENAEVIGFEPNPPFAALREVARWGLPEAYRPDDTVRRHSQGNGTVPTLAWVTAECVFPDRPLPAPGVRWMNYYGPPGSIPWVSFAQVLVDGALAPSTVSNKVVFVGALSTVGFTGGRGTDDCRTPYTRWTHLRAPGAEINATAYLNLVRGDWLKLCSPVMELAIVLAAGAALGFATAWVKPSGAAAAAFFYAVLSFVVVRWCCSMWHSWFPWAVIAVVQSPAAFAYSVLRQPRMSPKAAQKTNAILAGSPQVQEIPLVHFSVLAPASTSPGSSFVVEVWAHRQADRDAFLRSVRHETEDSAVLVAADLDQAAHGLKITVQLALVGLSVVSRKETISWSGRPSKISFLVSVPNSCLEGDKAGVVSVYAHGLRISNLNFSVHIALGGKATARVTSEEQRPRKAFACYASPDRREVLARVQGMQAACPGLDVFLDVHALRAGQNWEQAVRKAILDCDVFYLFWSESAQKSPEVEKEWRYALQEKGRQFIAPVPLVSPTVIKPPAELADKHFNDWPLEGLTLLDLQNLNKRPA